MLHCHQSRFATELPLTTLSMHPTPQELLAPYGYEVDHAWYLKNVHGRVDRDVFAALLPASFGSADCQRVSEEKDALFRKQAKLLGTPMIAGLPSALDMAKRLGVRCIAVTNAPRAAAEVSFALIFQQKAPRPCHSSGIDPILLLASP